MIEKAIAKMIGFLEGNTRDVAHFLKVYVFARTLGKLEKVDGMTQHVLELAAVVHDISCPLCRTKYGDVDGKHQEQESEKIIRPFLGEMGFSDRVIQRTVDIVSKHHTWDADLGIDHQILMEADFLVNADEGEYSKEVIQRVLNQSFRTKSGISLLRSLYL